MKPVQWTIWIGVTLVAIVATGQALFSPLLQWRDPVYIGAGIAGVITLTLLLIQPVLASKTLSGFSPLTGRWLHGLVGISLLAAVFAHIIGLWITSPPDVMDALLFVSPTPFSLWGVIAMWALILSAVLAFSWRAIHLRPTIWRWIHMSLAILIVVGTVAHALLIEGTMELASKTLICIVIVIATIYTLSERGFFTAFTRNKTPKS
ncbi:MAG: ferric reductase-like transmembrane domain-containing protein [Pseudomonadota bacterium]